MKNIAVITLVAMALFIIMGTTQAIAEDRYKRYEMADGNYMVFKMTPEEIKAEAAEKTRLDAVRQTIVYKPDKWVVAVELPESGEYITFPMSTDDIELARKATLEQAAAHKAAIRSAKADRTADIKTTVIEMADGNSITFTRIMKKAFSYCDSWLARQC